VLHDYPDITSRIKDPVLWYDTHGVPRYDSFTPSLCPDIYANEVALMEIACQACGDRFPVELHNSLLMILRNGKKLSDKVRDNSIHYGDPPIHGGGCSGNTMNCDDLRIIEFWRRDRFDWTRVPELEIRLQDGSSVA